MPGKYRAYPEYKVSGEQWLGDVPSQWDIFDGKRVFKNRRELSKDNDEQLAASQKYGVVPQSLMMDMNDAKVMLALKGTSSFRHVEKNDFVISLRSFEGGIEHSNYVGCVSPAYTVLNSTKAISPSFFRYFFKSGPYIAALQSTTDSLRDGKSITFDQFGSIPLILSKIEEQENIANFLDHETAKIDTLIGKQQQLIKLLKEKRQAVISHAVTKGLNPKAKMKDSGVEWLGEVPEHWRITKLGQLALMQEGPGLRTWQFKDHGTRVICVTNITEEGINFSKLEKFISTEEYLSSYQHFTVNTGDLLISSSGNSWGKVAKYLGNEKVILNTSTIRLNELKHRPLLLDFIQNFLQSDSCREQIGIAMTGSCQPNFGPTHLNEIKTPIPPIEEQLLINEFILEKLKKYNEPLQACELAINLMYERRTALISAAVTGKIDVRNWQAPKESKTNREIAA